MTEVSYEIPQRLPDATQLLTSAQQLVAIPEASEREEAVHTVFKLIHGVLGDVDNAKKRRVKKANETFHRKVGRHEAPMQFLRAAGFIDADDPEAAEGEGKDALLSMPVAYISRLTDAHHTLARVATEAGIQPPSLPGSGFNPYLASVQKMDATRNPKAPESWKSEADKLKDEVNKRRREMIEKVEHAPPVNLRPAAFWLAAGRRLEEVIREATAEDEERTADSHLLKEQVMSAKVSISGGGQFASADKKRLAELSRKRVHEACILRVICPDKSVLQVHFRSAERGDKVLELIRPLLAPNVTSGSWYLYQTPPLKRLQSKETLAEAGLSPGANMYLGFDGDKPQPPYLEPGLVEQLGHCRPQDGGVVAPSAFTGEAMGWGAGQKLGGSPEPATVPPWLKQSKSGTDAGNNATSAGSGGSDSAPG
eukprot:CAMPEP_0197634384 /NCGR_PEP_ID=MMETSP1338-20131121/10492_1 /TAXON_ID=43686 ORGANISM="Pelagodinium beii, Strain RCC1491" /NCGR_SAMPLE_ID=MMETSP1338 /ASSEMBLY_ACC=CAM_ASM_000754 /LENGTH=423 /DNA_ID=CAMNT_0043206239 /DNA_START=50 /DNA_END=1321 /DNA_ORIENTATION=-